MSIFSLFFLLTSFQELCYPSCSLQSHPISLNLNLKPHVTTDIVARRGKKCNLLDAAFCDCVQLSGLQGKFQFLAKLAQQIFVLKYLCN